MLKKLIFAFGATGAALTLGGFALSAGRPVAVEMTLAMPRGSDPLPIFLTSDGFSTIIPGLQLLPATFMTTGGMMGGGGVDFRSGTPGVQQYERLEFTSDSNLDTRIVTTVDPPFDNAPYFYAPWAGGGGPVPSGTTLSTFDNLGFQNNAVGAPDPFNPNNSLYADYVLTQFEDNTGTPTTPSQSDIDNFAASSVRVQAFYSFTGQLTVPEPGALALFGGVAAGGALAGLRFRRASRKR